MGIDARLLEANRSYDDHDAGISETFLQPVIGGAPTVAILSRPLTDPLPVGWVICPSFGLEQIHLGRLDTMVARGLSAAGFPVLRYHGQGYGDSATLGPASLNSHVEDAGDAVDLISGEAGVERVGVLGARFGGLVAALVADRRGLPLMGLWEPVVSGSRFIKDFFRTRLFSEMALNLNVSGASEVDRIRRELAANGWAEIKGFHLGARMYEETSAVDLTKAIRAFHGRALVISVSRTGRPGAAAEKLCHRLRELGAECAMEVVVDPLAAQFGQFRFQTIDGGMGKKDSQLPVNDAIASATSAWAVGLVPSGRSGSEVRG